jgi:hypothetical protein
MCVYVQVMPEQHHKLLHSQLPCAMHRAVGCIQTAVLHSKRVLSCKPRAPMLANTHAHKLH